MNPRMEYLAFNDHVEQPLKHHQTAAKNLTIMLHKTVSNATKNNQVLSI